jgi:hypothetical protein
MPIIRNCNVEKINKPITYAQYKNGVNFFLKIANDKDMFGSHDSTWCVSTRAMSHLACNKLNLDSSWGKGSRCNIFQKLNRL